MPLLEYVPSTMPVVQRSVMYTPGNNARLIEKARTFTSDLVVLDLEDSVAPTEKEHARRLVGESTAAVAESGADVYVRLNAWDTGMTDEDLEAIVGPSLDGVVLPKTESPENVQRLDEKLSSLESKAGMAEGAVSVQLLAETAKGIINAEASGRSSSRVNSIVFGAVDYARDMRIKLTGAGTIAARSAVAMAARSAGVVAIDPPWPAFADTDGFAEDCRMGSALGYEGRMLIHPNQIEPSHAIYAPHEEDVAYATEVVEAFEKALEEGLASVAIGGRMIDWAVYRSEKDLLAKVELIAAKERQKADRRRSRAAV
jgi:citrate lyase subunit beta/citryl-CoA lyase